MSERANFLLVSGSLDHYWHDVIEEALAPLGALETGIAEGEIEHHDLNIYDLIIVDATAVGNVSVLVTRIRSHQPTARIIVATASPTWERAREAFQAGAIDYVRKSLDREELRTVVRVALRAYPNNLVY